MPPEAPIRIGVSACLLGQEVRYDGGHKRDSFLVDTLGPLVEFVPVCPEFELGLGVPRETLRLERHSDEVRLIAPQSGSDHTKAMRAFAVKRTAALAQEGLSGYVLKKDSPSCGMERVRIFGDGGMPARKGRGLFASALMQRYPHLPVEEEGRLNDARIRENFIERIFAYHRLRGFFGKRWNQGGLVAFHTAHKLQLMAHSPRLYRELGRLVGEARQRDRAELRETYEASFMEALATIATRARQVKVLQHAARSVVAHAPQDVSLARRLAALIADYRAGLVPLIVPLTLMRHYVRLYEIVYLRGQVYLEPHPAELMLRNHV